MGNVSGPHMPAISQCSGQHNRGEVLPCVQQVGMACASLPQAARRP